MATNYAALPLAVEIDAAVELLNRAGLLRAANRLQLKGKKKPTAKTVRVYAGHRATAGSAVRISADLLHTADGEVEGER